MYLNIQIALGRQEPRRSQTEEPPGGPGHEGVECPDSPGEEAVPLPAAPDLHAPSVPTRGQQAEQVVSRPEAEVPAGGVFCRAGPPLIPGASSIL